MSTINSKEINDKISALPSREQLSKEQQRQEDIAAINDYALRNPNKVFDDNFKEQRQYLTEETWKAVIQANPDMQDSASDKWRKIPDANIVNKYQGQAFSGEVRKAINEDGVKLAGLTAAVPGAIIGGGALANPVLSQMFYHPGTFFAETIGGGIGGYAGGAATDAITRGVSDYNSFANMIASNSTIPEQYAEMLNPGMLLGGLAGGVGGNVLYNNVVKPTVQRAALPYLMAMQLNKNIDNTVLPITQTTGAKVITAETVPYTNGKTSLKFYERPSTLTEAERLGIPKVERKMFLSQEEQQQLLQEANAFAQKYGYNTFNKADFTQAELESYIKQMIKQHNTFYRGVAMPTGEDLQSVKNILGPTATEEDILKYVSTHGRTKENGKQANPVLFISPFDNAKIYGSNGRTSEITRPYTLGLDRKSWIKNAEYPIYRKDSDLPLNDLTTKPAIYDIWNRTYYTLNGMNEQFPLNKNMFEYFKNSGQLDKVTKNAPYQDNEFVATMPMIFQRWVDDVPELSGSKNLKRATSYILYKQGGTINYLNLFK